MRRKEKFPGSAHTRITFSIRNSLCRGASGVGLNSIKENASNIAATVKMKWYSRIVVLCALVALSLGAEEKKGAAEKKQEKRGIHEYGGHDFGGHDTGEHNFAGHELEGKKNINFNY